MNMENVAKGYGPGKSTNGSRPAYASGNQTAYGKYGTYFIGEDVPTVYLTFDCGYEYTTPDGVRVTSKILDTLKEKNVKAVFFVTMWYCKSAPDLVQRMIDEGHVVGNHSNNHPVMPDQTIDTMVYEVTSLHDYVKEHFGYEMTLFRPPTGAFSTRSLSVVQSLGYKNVLWSFAHADWEVKNQPALESSKKNIIDSAHNGAIYLLHAVSTTNASVLGEVIDGIQSKGFEIGLLQ